MMTKNFSTEKTNAILIIPVITKNFNDWISAQPSNLQNWAKNIGFQAKAHQIGIYCNANGSIEKIFLGIDNAKDMESISALPAHLPEGIYSIDSKIFDLSEQEIALAWGMGCYQFGAYRKTKEISAKLFWSEDEKKLQSVVNELTSIYLIRDLINTPTEDLGPAELAEAVEQVAAQFGARVEQIVGDELLAKNFPAIHAVGRASVHQPRLIELTWGKPEHPRVALVGKGVCFDSGGLDLKTASGMRLMKKDMAGAAHALGLARLIMAEELPVNLHLLIPAVENSVSGDAYRPGDIIRMRNGKTVEISNTDAEGRLILADALAKASEHKPDYLFDFASLTGAAHVALGNRIAALYTDENPLADALMEQSLQVQDPMWRLPMFPPYRSFLNSKIADMINAADVPYGGSITAALFLKEFVPNDIRWAHFDMMCWSIKDRPGHPEGGDVMAIRAVYRVLAKMFS